MCHCQKLILGAVMVVALSSCGDAVAPDQRSGFPQYLMMNDCDPPADPCTIRELTGAERIALNQLRDNLWADASNDCQVMGSVINGHLTEDLLFGWNETVMRPEGVLAGDIHPEENGQMHLWALERIEVELGPGEYAQTARHEAAHIMGYSDETDAENLATSCA